MKQTKNEQRRTTQRSRGAGKKRKMSYRKKIVALQIGAITAAIFLLLMIGAVVLTKVLVGDAPHTQQASAQTKTEGENKPGNDEKIAKDQKPEDKEKENDVEKKEEKRKKKRMIKRNRNRKDCSLWKR